MKQNDWILASINNPDFTPMDFKTISDMTLDNTLLLTKERYKLSKYIIENPMFLKDGQFDSEKFDKFYEYQVLRFGEFSTENNIDNYEYNMWDVTRPKNGRVKNPDFQLIKYPNPDHISIGIAGPNVMSESEYSRKELAQRSKIYDSATGQYLDKSVNDISFTDSPLEYIKSIFQDPLVYAAWDSEGTHIDPYTKLLVKHLKGEWKLNDEGQYYTETLNGRSVLGKEIVSLGDYVTSENSFLNKYDFFDADGLDKSVTGTIFKNLTTIAPMLFLGPTGLMTYGGLFVAREMSKTLPMLYGMYLSFTDLEVKDSELLNTISAYGNKFTGGTSLYAQQNTFSAENFINLIGEVALLWGLQKAIANAYTKLVTGNSKALESAYGKAMQDYFLRSVHAINEGLTGKLSRAKVAELVGTNSIEELPTLMLGSKWMETIFGKAARDRFVPAALALMESRMKFGQDLSLVYMALISNTDVYESVLEKGGTPLEAAAIALGSTIGMFSVDKFLGLGEMFFDDAVTQKAFRGAWRTESDNILNTIRRETGATLLERDSKKKLTNFIGASINKARNFVSNYQSKVKDHTLGAFGKSIGEGLEEVSEELVTDIFKSLGELAGKLGYASLTDYGAWENPFERYMMSFLGGSIGGGLFYGVELFLRRNEPKIKEGEDELIYLIRNHKKEDLMRELDKLHLKGLLGSTTLSWETAKGADNKNYFITADEDHISQNDYVYQKLKEVYNHIDMIVNNNKIGLSEDELFENMILSDLRLNALKDFLGDRSYATGYLEEFHKIAKELLEIDLDIERLNGTTKDKDKRENSLSLSSLEELLSRKKELLKKRDEFLSGEVSLSYVKKMLFGMDPALAGNFMSVNIYLFTRNVLGKSFNDLSIAEKEYIIKKYSEYQQEERFNLDKAYEIYEQIEKDVSPELMSLLGKINPDEELKRYEELMKKYPTNLYLTYESKLEGESDEEYNSRNTLLEGESVELFNQRKLDRLSKIDKYNKDNFANFVKDFADMGLYSSSFRTMKRALNARRSDVQQAILNLFKYVTRNTETGVETLDKKSTETIRLLLSSSESLEKLIESVREYFKGLLNTDFAKQRANASNNSVYFKLLREILTDEGDKVGERLTLGEVLKALLLVQNDNPDIDILESYTFDKDTENQIKNGLELLLRLELLRTLREKLELNVIQEFTATKRIDPLNLEGSRDIIDSEVNSRLALELENITKFLKDIYKIEIDPNSNNAYKLVEHFIDQLLREQFEYSELDINDLISDTTENKTNELIPTLSNIYELLQSHPYIEALNSLESNLYENNPALKVFSKISAKLGNTDINIELFLSSLYLRYEEIENLQDFQITDEEKKILKELQKNLQTTRALIYAAAKNTSVLSPIGLNKAVNQFISRHSDVISSDEILPEIDENLGLLLMLEFNTYNNEIEMWLQDGETTRIDKVSMFEQSEKALNKALKTFYDTIKDSVTIKGVNLLEGYTSETTVLLAERILYNNVLKAIQEGKLTLEDVFSIIPKFVSNIDNIRDLTPSKLDEKLEYLTDYDKFTYFITTISLSIDLYRATLKDFINENPKIVPISILMYVSRIQLAMLINPIYVNKALEWVSSLFKTSPKLPIIPNTTILLGVGGSGKTEVPGRIAAKDGTDTWLSGPKTQQVSGLLGKLPKGKGMTVDELLNTILGETKAAELQKVIDEKKSNNDFYSKANGMLDSNTFKLKENIVFQNVADKPKIIIIDEATHIPEVKLQIIAKYALDNNILLILLGDACLSGFNNNYMSNLDKEVLFGWRTPKLYISLRDAKVQKYYNLLSLLEMLEPLIDSVNDIESETARKNIVEKFLPNFKLRYHIDLELSGDMITEDIPLNVISIFKNNKDSQLKLKKVAFIGNPESTHLQTLKNNGIEVVEFKDIVSIQGLEFDYVVADLEWVFEGNNERQVAIFLRNLYTVITRSKKGTVLINNKLGNSIKNQKDDRTGNVTDIRDLIDEFRPKVLNDLETNSVAPPVNPLTVPNPTPLPEVTEEPDMELLLQDLELDDVERIEEDEVLVTTMSEEEVEDSKEEEKKVTLNENTPARCYTNVHLINAQVVLNEDGTYTWIGNGSNKDISIFLPNGVSVTSIEDKDSYIEKVLQLKSIIIFGKEFYKLADVRIHELFEESAFDNIEYSLVAEEATDNNTLMGLSNLSNDKRTINNKIITIVAKIKGRDGTIYTLTLGGAADPSTWKEFALGLCKNSNPEETAYGEKLLNGIIPVYELKIKDLLIGEEFPVEITTSSVTTLISRDSDGNPNPELRLHDLLTDRSPFDNKTKYAVRSKVKILRREIPGVDKKWIGKPVIFVSSNVFLKPDELMDRYIELKENGTYLGIRMIPLSNKGVSFNSLFNPKWWMLYTASNSKNSMPFELLSLGIRMYISMWNFRANLAKFMLVYNEWKTNNNYSDEFILELIKADYNAYNEARRANGGNYLDEKSYRDSVQDKSKLQILWDFNDSLAESVRQFRLGYEPSNGLYIRKLSNIREDNKFYSERIQRLKDKNVYGTYIDPTLADDYLKALNSLFDNVINKMVPTDRNVLYYIDKKKALDDDWFKLKVKDKVELEVNGINELGEVSTSKIKFLKDSVMTNLPLILVLTAKYLRIRALGREMFDEAYIEGKELGNNPFSIYFTNSNDEKIELDYRGIAEELSLIDDILDGTPLSGFGLVPYTEVEGVGFGTKDMRLNNLFSLMFHGLVALNRENNFDGPELRASDADFKYGFFSDPITIKGGEGAYADTSTNEALFSTNLLPGFPIITFRILDESEVRPLTQPVLEEVPVLNNDLLIINELVNQISLILGILVSSRKLNKIKSVEELINYVNQQLNPIFATGEDLSEIRKRTKIHEYFLLKRAINITQLVDHVELKDGLIVSIPINLGITIKEELPWNEEGKKIVIDEKGLRYEIIYEPNSGKIMAKPLTLVEIKGEPDSETGTVKFTMGNIKFTIISEILDRVDTILDESFIEDIQNKVAEIFDRENPDMQLEIGTDATNNILIPIFNKIIEILQDPLYESDESVREDWVELRDEIINTIIPDIIKAIYLKEGCL